MQIVRSIDVVTARVPLIQIDATEIDYPQQRRQILNDRKVNDVSRAMRDRTYFNPGRPRLRRALHKKEFARGPVGITLHHHRAILKMWQQDARDIRVILQQISLGYFQLGQEDVIQIGQLDLSMSKT